MLVSGQECSKVEFCKGLLQNPLGEFTAHNYSSTSPCPGWIFRRYPEKGSGERKEKKMEMKWERRWGRNGGGSCFNGSRVTDAPNYHNS